MKYHRTFVLSQSLIALAHAAANPIITWTPGVNIAGDSDVVTTGTLVAAFNLGTTNPSQVSGTTVNGVPFAPFAVPFAASDPPAAWTTTVGAFSVQFSDQRFADNSLLGSAAAPYSTLSPAYKTLLSAGVADTIGGGTVTLTMTGLTNGQAYIFEWWSNDADLNSGIGSINTIAVAFNAVTLTDNVNNTNGSPGQYAVGNFTGDALGTATVAFTTFTSESFPVLNAFQLRTIAAPEPTSCAMLAIGACGLLSFRGRSTR